MTVQQVELTERLSSFVQRCVESGEFLDESDVVRAALRLLEEREEARRTQLETLRQIAEDSRMAYERGEYREYDADSLGNLFGSIAADLQAEVEPR